MQRRAQAAQDERWVLTPTDGVSGRLRTAFFTGNSLPMPKGTMFSLSIHSTIALAASGRFVALMPASVARFNPAQRALKVLPVKLAGLRVAVGIVER